MNERLHQMLDGELPRAAASQSELDELHQTEAALAAVIRAVPVEPLPDLAPAVARRIEELPAPAAGQAARQPARLFGWLWSPRPVMLNWRPAYAFVFALLVLAPLIFRDPAAVPGAAPQQVLVQFRLDAPNASGVALAGNFSNWQPKYQLTRTAGGVWTVTIPLEQGVYKYAFVVNGKTWQADPLAPSESDGFGGQNSQIAVLKPDLAVES